MTPARVLHILLMGIFLVVRTNVMAADEDPLQDFCVALNYTGAVTLNGLPCKNPQQVQAADFTSQQLQQPGQLIQKLGVAVNLASALTFPGLNTQGLSIARIDFQPNGLNPPHVHPRATEVLFLAEGSLLVGFVLSDGNNTLFTQQLYKGDLFVFPRGLVHFQFNVDKQNPALAISALNSQNPGVSQVAAALFASNPPFPQEVLQIAFGIDQKEVQQLTSAVGNVLGTH